jgi:hypothetical protein
MHHEDTIEEVPLNIFARLLNYATIRIFNSDTLADPERRALPEVMNALSYFLRKKGELDKKVIEVVLYEVLKNLFEQMDIEERAPGTSIILNTDSYKKETNDDLFGEKKTVYTITYDEICNSVMKEVDGSLISPRTFESPDYPKVTYDSLLAKCRSVFEGKNARLGTGKNNK